MLRPVSLVAKEVPGTPEPSNLLISHHLVVSAIPSIVNIARKNNVSVIASDEGSVKNGADVALGVKEKELGIIGAKIVVSQIVKSDKINNKFDSNPNLIIFKNKISLLKPLKNALYDQELIVKG